MRVVIAYTEDWCDRPDLTLCHPRATDPARGEGEASIRPRSSPTPRGERSSVLCRAIAVPRRHVHATLKVKTTVGTIYIAGGVGSENLCSKPIRGNVVNRDDRNRLVIHAKNGGSTLDSEQR